MGSFCACGDDDSDNDNNADNQRNTEAKKQTMDPDVVLDFWFGSITDQGQLISETEFKRWMMGTKEFDDEIRAKFGTLMHEVIVEKAHSDWKNTSKGCMALVLLTDQFPRNVYRGTAQMFASDEYAVEIVDHAIQQKFDDELLALHPVYTFYLYMVFQHSEDIVYQRKTVEYNKAMIPKLSESHQFCTALEFALKGPIKEHFDVVERFGRYPHRNELLQRESTAEEIEFLANTKFLWMNVKTNQPQDSDHISFSHTHSQK